MSIRYGSTGPCADGASHNRTHGMKKFTIFRSRVFVFFILFLITMRLIDQWLPTSYKVYDQGSYKLVQLKKDKYNMPDGTNVMCWQRWCFCTFRYYTHLSQKVKHWRNLLISLAPLYRMDTHDNSNKKEQLWGCIEIPSRVHFKTQYTQ